MIYGIAAMSAGGMLLAASLIAMLRPRAGQRGRLLTVAMAGFVALFLILDGAIALDAERIRHEFRADREATAIQGEPGK